MDYILLINSWISLNGKRIQNKLWLLLYMTYILKCKKNNRNSCSYTLLAANAYILWSDCNAVCSLTLVETPTLRSEIIKDNATHLPDKMMILIYGCTVRVSLHLMFDVFLNPLYSRQSLAKVGLENLNNILTC